MMFIFLFFLKGICGPFSGFVNPTTNQTPSRKRKVTKETVMYNIALIQTLNSDWNFQNTPNLDNDDVEGSNGDNPKQGIGSPNNLSDSFKFKMKTLKKLGMKVVQDRTLCFAGRMLRGILMPKNRYLQTIIMRRIFLWYFPCIRIVQNAYRVHNRCFITKEKKFIRMMKKVAANAWLKSNTLKLFYFQ